MFTQCPECLTIQAITLVQLRHGKGLLRCSQCGSTFDALERINETADINPPPPHFPKHLPWDEVKTVSNKSWGAGILLGMTLLLGQVCYFEGHAFSQNPALRPHLIKLCQLINCHLPDYKNLTEITVLHGSFMPGSDQNYTFKMVLNNQAAFDQPYPYIKLSLLDYNDHLFAYRIFKPNEYLSKDTPPRLMASEATTEVNLIITAPKTKIGGSRFDLSF